MEEKRIIRVTGKGMLRLRPDTTKIVITLSGMEKEYGNALDRSAKDTEKLRELFSGFGFEKGDLKTLDLSIDPEYESYQEKGHYKQRFIGYRFSHVLKIEFPSDNGRLGSVLYALARSPLDPEFRISYTVADPEAAKNELLGRAVKDAAQKAEVLSEAAGVSLKEILSVDYSWGQINFDVTPMNRMMADESVMLAKAAPAGGYALDIEPDDIEVSDTVTVVWAI